MALRRRGDQQQRPVGHPGDRPACRAWQVRPLVRVRWARHGPRRPPIIPVSVRADHAYLGAERLDAAHRPRRDRVDQLRRALPRRPDLRLHRPHHQGPGGLERGDELGGQGRAQLQPRSPHGARPALRGRSGVRRRREGPLGLLGGRRDRGGQGDRSLHRPGEGPPARPSWPVLPGKGPRQHGPLPSGSSGHHSGRRLGGRARAGRADGRRCVLRRPGAVGRAACLSRSERAHGQVWPHAGSDHGLPGVMPIIGSTEAEARDKLSLLQSWLTPTNALTLVTSRIGYDVTGFPLDGPVPAPPPDASSQTFSRVLYETARRENMTLRDLYNLTAAARGHWVLCGTPKRIADTLEEWFVEEAADGFNVLPPYFPGALVDFVDQVVPEFQARGLFRREYEGATLRDHFGLPRVPAPARHERHVGAQP